MPDALETAKNRWIDERNPVHIVLIASGRDDVIDFCLPGHERKLLGGWYELEGVYGAKYRWMGPRASALLLV